MILRSIRFDAFSECSITVGSATDAFLIFCNTAASSTPRRSASSLTYNDRATVSSLSAANGCCKSERIRIFPSMERPYFSMADAIKNGMIPRARPAALMNFSGPN